MALVVSPALSQAASGDLGAINYSRWRGKFVARKKYSPVQPNTTIQVNQQNRLLAASQAWGGLSTDQRQAWKELARKTVLTDRLQQQYTPTGYQVFVQYATQSQVFGYAIPTDPPGLTAINLVYDVLFRSIIGSGVGRIEPYFNPGEVLTCIEQIFRTGAVVSAGYTPGLNEYRQRAIINPAVDAWADNTVTVGKIYWYRVRFTDRYGRGNVWFTGSILIQ